MLVRITVCVYMRVAQTVDPLEPQSGRWRILVSDAWTCGELRCHAPSPAAESASNSVYILMYEADSGMSCRMGKEGCEQTHHDRGLQRCENLQEQGTITFDCH